MHELIKIEDTTIGDESVPAIRARDLHEFLEIKTRFNVWIQRRLEECRLLENRDFLCVAQNCATALKGAAVGKDFILNLDAAKHIAMIERTDKGYEAREYFIECEKQLKQALSSEEKLIAALSEYQRVIVQPLIEFKEEALPKVSYHDKVLNSPDLVNISENYPISAIKLNKILQEEGVQYKDKKGEWALYSKYKDRGYASTKTQVIKNGEYEVLKVHLKWTQKGRLFIYDLLKSKGILPVCEQPC